MILYVLRDSNDGDYFVIDDTFSEQLGKAAHFLEPLPEELLPYPALEVVLVEYDANWRVLREEPFHA